MPIRYEESDLEEDEEGEEEEEEEEGEEEAGEDEEAAPGMQHDSLHMVTIR